MVERTRTARHVAASGPRQDRKGIQSLEVGLRMLTALAEAKGAASLKDISQAAGLAPSKAHRYLVSMTRAGLAVQRAGNGRYDLGPLALKVGLAALNRIDAVQTGAEAVARVVERTDHTAMLAIWSEPGPVIIRWINGPRAVYTTLSTGSVLPTVQSATGRVFVTFLPTATTRPTVARELAKLKTQGKALSLNGLEALKAATRAAGMAEVSGDFIPGLMAASVPILNADGDAVAALTLVNAQDRFSDTALAELKAIGREASSELGWNANP